MEKKLSKDDFDYFMNNPFSILQAKVEILECELWELKNPPKFKKGDIVIQAEREFEILGFKGIDNMAGAYGRHKYFNVYCAYGGDNCIDIDDIAPYNLKLKDGKEAK